MQNLPVSLQSKRYYIMKAARASLSQSIIVLRQAAQRLICDHKKIRGIFFVIGYKIANNDECF
ncbi:hypothetical protein C0674_05870 [Sporolactobacillus terrae]|uniref:Uncharacterized protein n=1 Tax=Sporolactobacillus terrae TaxID=269673 RepID=A0ABX5Q6B2_9BACL|nr:hypothetical protein C0674_05870 [Sporolactobacillus terrae]QAA25154.1 hypothetical protein C0679_05845 [Sporolactobacillus terrae]